jgi:hypothetical protein
MPEETESSPTRKRRVIHWNPDAGKEQQRRRWTLRRLAAWVVGGPISLLLVAAVVIRGAKLVFGPQVFGGAPAATAPAQPENAAAAFATETKAQFEHDNAAKGLAQVAKLPQNHPSQLPQLVIIQKGMIDGETLLERRDFAGALAKFEQLNRQIDEYVQSISAKQEAQDGFNTIMQRIRELEGSRNLMPEALEAANTAAAESSRFFKEGSFLAAKRALEAGFGELDKLVQARTELIGGNLLRGQQALSQGAKDTATAAFTAVLQLAPGNEDATLGLKRAETIDRVHALLLQAEGQEKQGQFKAATESYRKAFELDPLSARAQEGQSRAARLDKESRYDQAVAAAQAAFSRSDWQGAIEEAQNALQVYPDKTEIQSLIATAKRNDHIAAVNRALQKGFAAEKAYEWTTAQAAYREVHALEPNQKEATEGIVRSGTMLRALAEYEAKIQEAEKLEQQAEFQRAIQSYNNAIAKKPAYLAPSERVIELNKRLQFQNTLVPVTFSSDNNTMVSISGLLEPQKVTTRTLQVPPGDYSVVGRRKGYQDVVMKLIVRAGSTPPAFRVVCSVRSG